MGENYGHKVEYKCFNDCRQEGCPGHVARFGYSRCSDVEYFEIDGKNEYFLDHNMLEAMLESKRQMEDTGKKQLKYYSGDDLEKLILERDKARIEKG